MTIFWRVQVEQPSVSTLPQDTIVNTFHFRDPDRDILTPGAAEASAAAIKGKLNTFYQAIALQLPSALVANNWGLKFYNMDDPEPRVPWVVESLTVNGAGGAALPREAAACISWQAAIASGDNPRRRRGRNYVGPLIAAAQTVTGGRTVLADATRTVLANAADALITEAALDVELCIFSRADAQGLAVGQPPANAFNYTPAQLAIGYREVVSGWVDNALDTVRKRGSSATGRVTFAG